MRLGGHLIAGESLSCALSGVLATASVAVQTLRLAAHPTAQRACREFVTRTLQGWRLSGEILFANLVVSELVSSSSIHAGTEIDLSVAWDCGALRLSVRDHGPAPQDQRYSPVALHGRGLTVVAGLSRVFGVLPGAFGGKVVGAVLEAPQPRPSTRRTCTEFVTTTREKLGYADGRGIAWPPFCADRGG